MPQKKQATPNKIQTPISFVNMSLVDGSDTTLSQNIQKSKFDKGEKSSNDMDDLKHKVKRVQQWTLKNQIQITMHSPSDSSKKRKDE